MAIAGTQSDVRARWTDERLDAYAAMSQFEQIISARTMTPSEKVVLGGMLFDRECELVEAKIRATFVAAPAHTVRALLNEYIRRKFGPP
jgi:hypothetical protein